jgi:nucleotide-binding universal stress UspA family protein
MVYTKILVALDGSDSSKRALHRAVVLAEKFGSKLTLLTVFHRRVLLPLVEEGGEMAVDDEIHESYWGSVRELHVRILEEAERLIRKSYPKVRFEAVLAEGRPSAEICREAQKREVDLVVVGNSGMGGIKGRLLGSTSRSVVDSCSATVMVVK